MVPFSEEAWEELRAVKQNATCIGDFHGARNVQQLKLFWVLITYLVENTDKFSTKEQARKALFWELKFVEPYFDYYGRLHFEIQSIALESMKQVEFNQLFNKCVDKICEWMNDTPEHVREVLYEMINPAKGYDLR